MTDPELESMETAADVPPPQESDVPPASEVIAPDQGIDYGEQDANRPPPNE